MSTTVIHFVSLTVIHFVSLTVIRFVSLTVIHFVPTTVIHFVSLTDIQFVSLTDIHFVSTTVIHFVSLTVIHFVSLTVIHFASLTVIHFMSTTVIYFVSLTVIHFVSLTVMHFVSTTVIYFVSLTVIHFVSTTVIRFVSTSVIHFVSTKVIYFVSLTVIHFVSLTVIIFVSLKVIHFLSLAVIHFVSLTVIHFVSTTVIHFVSRIVIRFVSLTVIRFVSLPCKGTSLVTRSLDDGLGHFINRDHAEEFLQHLNSLATDLEYTIEHPNPDGSIPFLDILIHPDNSTSIYRKPTNTNLGTHYSSATTMSSKESVVRTLTRRAYKLCCPQHLNTELRHLEATFLSNGYPLQKIRHLMHTTLERARSNCSKSQSRTTSSLVAFIPYYNSHVLSMKKSLGRYEISTSFHSSASLKSLLSHTKSTTPPSSLKNVIYNKRT